MHSRSPQALRPGAPEYVVGVHDGGVVLKTALSTAEPEGFRGDTSSHLGHVLLVFAGATAQTSPPLPPTVPDLQKSRPTQAGRLLNYLSL